MKGLSSLERVVLECIGNQIASFDEILKHSGLGENVCFNVLQALVIRGILGVENGHYKISKNISPLLVEELNSEEAKEAESLELIEAVVGQKNNKIFRFQKIAMDSRDEKIFAAMLMNLDSFLKDANRKAEKEVLMKNRKVVFWGMGEVRSLLNQVISGEQA